MLVRLETEDERSATFDCSDDDLNEFFFRDSQLANSELVAVTRGREISEKIKKGEAFKLKLYTCL